MWATDYKFGLFERTLLTCVFLVQWGLVSLSVVTVVDAHGEMSAGFMNAMGIMNLLVFVGIVAGFMGRPMLYGLSELYRMVKA